MGFRHELVQDLGGKNVVQIGTHLGVNVHGDRKSSLFRNLPQCHSGSASAIAL